MAEPSALLLFAARLSKAEKEAVLEQDRWFLGSKRFDVLRDAIEDAALDRLIRADGCLSVARKLILSSDEEDLRTATGRAYYCIHHAIRAMALWKNKWDPDGHEESITEFKELLADNVFCGQTGLSRGDYKSVSQARTNRHVADYSPYDQQRSIKESSGFEVIIDRDWQRAAQFNVEWAEKILAGAFKYVGV